MRPDFKKMELIPAIVQDYLTKEVLMLAYVNEEAYDKMLELKQTVFYSRSRKKLWHKGEESGHFQDIKGMYLDCDLDTLLIYVKQTGVACHTGAYSCFFNAVEPYDSCDIFMELEKTIADRKIHPARAGSGSAYTGRQRQRASAGSRRTRHDPPHSVRTPGSRTHSHAPVPRVPAAAGFPRQTREAAGYRTDRTPPEPD